MTTPQRREVDNLLADYLQQTAAHMGYCARHLQRFGSERLDFASLTIHFSAAKLAWDYIRKGEYGLAIDALQKCPW